MTIVEGESLVNDASALTTYTVAVAAVSGHVSVGGSLGLFGLAVVGGIAIGLAVGWAVRVVSRRI